MGLKLAPMAPFDLIAVTPMLQRMAEEEARPYPRVRPDSPQRIQGWLLERLGTPWFGAFVVRDGNKAKGFIWGTVEARPLADPPAFVEMRVLYVAPSHRRRGVASRLIAAMFAWGRSVLGDECVFECDAVVGHPAYQMWVEAGGVPLTTRFAWVDSAGHARAGQPLALRPVRRDTSAHG